MKAKQIYRRIVVPWFGAMILLASVPLSSRGQYLTEDGELVFRRYNGASGELVGEELGSFNLAKGAQRYQLKIFDPSGPKKELVVSNYNTTYEAVVSAGAASDSASSRPKGAFAAIHDDPMPNVLAHWGVPQIFCLAILMTERFTDVTEGGKLKPEYVPEYVTRTARAKLWSIRSECELQGDGKLPKVRFIAVEKLKSAAAEHENEFSFTLATMSVLAQDRGFPTKVVFQVNAMSHALGPRPDAHPLFVYEYNGTVAERAGVPKLEAVAYDPGMYASLNDYRNASTRPFGFALLATDEPPFEGTKSYAKMLNARKERKDLVSARIEKARVTGIMCLVTCVPFWMLIKRIREQEQGAKAIA
jgi:hypothetical protein